jgi:uncharacterized protein YbaA (DUF1428 family)
LDVITVQEAKHSTQTEQVFTINLGVFVKSFYEAVWGRPLSGFATEADCAVSVVDAEKVVFSWVNEVERQCSD